MGSALTARTAFTAARAWSRAGIVSMAEEVHAALGQAFGLLAVDVDGLVERDVAEGLERLAQRARSSPPPGRGPGPLRARSRAPSRLMRPTCRSNPWGPSLKRCAPKVFVSSTSAPGLEVLLVDGADERGVGEVQLVEAAVHEHAAGVQHRAHGAVADHDAVLQPLEEALHRRGLHVRPAHDRSV